MRELPSGTVTLLFTDIEGSTRLLHELGDGYAGALAEHRRALRQAFARHGGVEVDTQGDAFFVAFASARAALRATDEGQRALAGGPVRVRMGLHTGEPTVTDEGYVGLDVHRGARIAAAGHGGQVVMSQTTRELAGSDLTLRDLGEHRLKDLSAPQRLWQLGDSEFPPLKTLYRTNLPVQPSPLVGRERELAEGGTLLREHRLVTLTGPGGSGKTRLALQLAAEAIEDFSDGVWWVPLQALTDPELVLTNVAQTLAAGGELTAYLKDKHLLLLLDNLEQVIECSPRLAELLGSTTGVKLLVTSREPLRIEVEHEYAVEPLAEDQAVELFRLRAADGEPIETVREICVRLDCLPLAVELAAARTRLLPPDKLLERLARRLPILTGGRRDAPERQRTLRATIEWSYDLLTPEEQQLFARLSVFAGGFDVEAAEAVVDAELETLQSLLDKSLVRQWGTGRLGMLETIRELASERLEASGAAGELRRRHAEHFLALAQSASLTNEAEGEQRHDLVIRDRENVRGALEWGLESGEIEHALQLAASLENYWVTNSPLEGRRWLGELLERAGELPGELRALALRAYGATHAIFGVSEEGTRLYEAALAEYRRLGDERGIGIMLLRLGVERLWQGDAEGARAFAEESLRLHRKAAFKRGEAQALSLLAGLELKAGEEDRAFELYERSAALCKESGFTWARVNVLLTLSELLLGRGRLVESQARVRELLPLARKMGDRQNTIYGVALLARLATEAGQLEHSGRLWGAIEAEETRAPVGHWDGERDAYAEPVLANAGPEFEQGRSEGGDSRSQMPSSSPSGPHRRSECRTAPGDANTVNAVSPRRRAARTSGGRRGSGVPRGRRRGARESASPGLSPGW